MKGRIISWKEDKGFGFISPEGTTEQIFFHISSVKKAVRKPKVGDVVVFEAAKDSQGRFKAKYVLLEGVSLASSRVAQRIVTEPVKKDVLDYFVYFILAILFFISLGGFIRAGSSKVALVTGAIFLVVLFCISNRKKQPSNKLFSCSKCRVNSVHDERTVLAWNRGLNRLYCKSCHQAWLREQPKEQRENRASHVSSKSGCLGLFLIIASVPVVCISGAVFWVV